MFRHSCVKLVFVLFEQIDNITYSSSSISKEAQVLTSDASKLTPDNVTSAAKVVGQIFNESRKASPEVKLTRFLKWGGKESHPKLHSLFREMDLGMV